MILTGKYENTAAVYCLPRILNNGYGL